MRIRASSRFKSDELMSATLKCRKHNRNCIQCPVRTSKHDRSLLRALRDIFASGSGKPSRSMDGAPVLHDMTDFVGSRVRNPNTDPAQNV